MGKWLERIGYYDQKKNDAVLDGIEINQDENKQPDNVITLTTLTDLDNYGIMNADKCYVNRLLIYKASKPRSEIINQYCNLWVDTYHNEPYEYKKANTARKKANNWIRHKVLGNT